MKTHRLLLCALVTTMALFIVCEPPRSNAYIGGPPLSLGLMCSWSTHAAIVRVEALDRAKGVIIYRKLRDVKGKWPTDEIRHAFPAAFGNKGYIFDWAEVGKTVVIFALESYKWGHTYIDGEWYACNTADWKTWNVSHSEPLLLRMYCGRTERLADAVTAIVANKEVVVPGMIDSPVAVLQKREAPRQRLRTSLKLLDYNPKRDVVGPGGDEMIPLVGMPAFTHISPLARTGSDAQAVSLVDFDGDGKLDLCLVSGSRVVLWRNGGDYFSEVPLPEGGGARAGVWADYNGDGRPDLYLATPQGPRLFANLATGFREDSHLLPPESAYNLTCAAWIDQDGDGRPDLLLGNGFHGLRLYRNRGKGEALPTAWKLGQPVPEKCRWFEDVSDTVGLGTNGISAKVKGDTLSVCDVNGDGRPDFLYGAGMGVLVLNTAKGFRELSESGIVFRTGGVGPVFGDFDNDGHSDLFVPGNDVCKLFRNDGKGKFADVTSKAGELAKLPRATSGTWGDLDNDGLLDLVVGCMKGPNRVFRNKGDGTFEEKSLESGLNRRIFNTQAVALADVNGDGVLDAVFHNEGQDSCVLIGKRPAKGLGVLTLRVGATSVLVRVRSRDQVVASQQVGLTQGRGGQAAAEARFALATGRYQIEARYGSGVVRAKEIEVAGGHVKDVLEEKVVK